MKTSFAYILFLSVIVLWTSCAKEDYSERFMLLTAHTWQSDSLLADGTDASNEGELLEGFAGQAMFRIDGSGYVGLYTGKWSFSNNETEITINTDSLALPITANIEELTDNTFKITTSYPAFNRPPIAVRMTFIE